MRFARLIALAASTALLAGCGTSGLLQSGVLRHAHALGARAHQPGELTLYPEPDSQDTLIVSAIESAQTVVRLEMYMLTHQGVEDALIDAKNRGVEVDVMLEPNPFNPNNPNNPLPTNRVAAKYLSAGGLAIHWSNPAYTYTHAKMLIIDDQTAYVSTANFTKSGLGVATTASSNSREYIIQDSSKVDVAEYVNIFKADLARQPYPTIQDPDLVVSPINARAQILHLVDMAQHDLVFGGEVVGDPELTAHVLAKLQQGVHVRAMFALLKGNQPNPNLPTCQAWVAAGAEVRFQPKPFLHGKSLMVDNQFMYIGSTNFTTNSMDNNRELGLIVDQPALIQSVAQIEQIDWAGDLPVPAPAPAPAASPDAPAPAQAPDASPVPAAPVVIPPAQPEPPDLPGASAL